MPKEIIWKTDTTHEGDTVPAVMWGRDGSYLTIGVAPITKDADLSHTDGLWTDLDRAQVNNLIRVLRRARDQSYGRDE